MGILSEIFIANDAQIELLNLERHPVPLLTGITYNDIDAIKLTNVRCLLNQKDFNIAQIDDFETVREASDDGPWIYRIPSDFGEKLVTLTPDMIEELSRQLGIMSPEFQADGWSRNDITKLLNDLQQLAKQTFSTNEQLYLWNSL